MHSYLEREEDLPGVSLFILEANKMRSSSSVGYFVSTLCVCVYFKEYTYKYLCGNKCFKRIKYVNASVATNGDSDLR